jgi:MFS family permease
MSVVVRASAKADGLALEDGVPSRRRVAIVFLAFAFAYFLSTLVRGITATLSPALTAEFDLDARNLGLLAGGYFLGFALTQLPMGAWLDRHGPKRVVLCFLAMAVLGCMLFSVAKQFPMLLAARVLTGIGVSACLMGPLTGFRRWFEPALQLRTNSWMLMVGSMGLVGATLPVHWLVPIMGWRPLFWLLAASVLVAMSLIALAAPAWRKDNAGRATLPASVSAPPESHGYGDVWRNPFFRRMMPIGFINYGGFVAILTLWVMPWMTRVTGYSPAEAAGALFRISLAMLVTYWLWGAINPWLARRGIGAVRLIGWGLPVTMLMLAGILVAGPAADGRLGSVAVLFHSGHAGPAGRGARAAAGPGRPCAGGLQSGDISRRIRSAMGHRPADRPFHALRPRHGRCIPWRIRCITSLQHCFLLLLSLGPLS